MIKNDKLLKPNALLNILEDLGEEKKKVEKSEKKYRGIIHESRDAIYRMSLPSGQYTLMSRAAKQVFGYSSKEFIKNPLFIKKIIHPNFKNYFKEKWSDLLKDKVPKIYEYKIIDKTKKTRWIHQSNKAIFNKTGKIIAIEGICRDITKQKKSEKALKESKERAEKYLDLAGNIILTLNSHGEITLLNKKGYEILGHKPDTLIGKNWFNICIPRKDVKSIKEVFTKLMAGENKFIKNHENIVLTSDGKERLISWHNTLLNGIPGKIKGILSSGEDITERRKSEIEIKELNKKLKIKFKESQEKYKTIYESSSDAIMILEPPTWKFTSANPATIKMFQAKDEKEFITLGPWNVSPEKQPNGQSSSNEAKKMIEKAMKEGSNLFDWTHKRISGSDFPATILLTKMNIGGKDVLQATVRDVSEEKIAEIKLKDAYEELKTLDEVKSNFLLITSHELKTPITPIMIQAEMLLNKDLGPLTGKQKEGAEMIVRNMKRLTKLINDILDVSKISSKVMKIQLSTKDINNTVLKIFKEKKIEAEKKNIKLTLKTGDLPKLKFDDFRISQVILNLIDNAIKFTPEKGNIRIETKRKGEKVLISIKDTGKGISKKDLTKIFKPFFQSKPSYMEQHRGGTGLGLAIARGIINNHGGQIWVVSKPKKGAHFYFTLPIKNTEIKTKNLKASKAKDNKEEKGNTK